MGVRCGKSGVEEAGFLIDLALTLRGLARGEGEEGRTALAWALVNRRGAERKPDREFLLALAALCRALCGAEQDPTGGATHFHLHTENPDWATRETPRALAGGHLFYAPREAGHHG
jgi:hypothetical protein|tara:strand:+ start:10868 stop:11215 length:348 start_codon:yes stop_codon:yes gene_type:complete